MHTHTHTHTHTLPPPVPQAPRTQRPPKSGEETVHVAWEPKLRHQTEQWPRKDDGVWCYQTEQWQERMTAFGGPTVGRTGGGRGGVSGGLGG